MSPTVTDKLLEIALQIREPWKITDVQFSPDTTGRLDIYIDFEKGAIFDCPVCSGPATAYDTNMMTWRHRDFFEYEAYFHARVPRVKCRDGACGVKKIGVPWARSSSGLTLKMEKLMMSLVREMPVNAVSRIYSIIVLKKVIHAASCFNRCRVSGNLRTSMMRVAAWSFGLVRPCSHFSRVRGETCNS